MSFEYKVPEDKEHDNCEEIVNYLRDKILFKEYTDKEISEGFSDLEIHDILAGANLEKVKEILNPGLASNLMKVEDLKELLIKIKDQLTSDTETE